MSSMFEKLKHEAEALIPPTIYFMVALHGLALVRALMLEGTGIPLATSLTITLGALLLAKAVLLADLLPFINRYPHKPLAFNIAWKTLVYSLLATVLHYLEHLVEAWRATGALVAANRKLLADMVWEHFLAIEILIVVLVLVYSMISELVRKFGRQSVRHAFFGTSAGAQSH
jgi:hypothetical protein